MVGLILLVAPGCAASVLVTYSAAGVQTTPAANASTYTFNSLPTGLNNNVTWSGIGSLNTVWVQAADQYGGAGGTGNYAVVGAEAQSANLLSTTLTLNAPQSYVGLWVSALDNQNQLTLYSGTTELTSFNVGILATAIGACTGTNAYCGNPNNSSQDTSEPFAYLNFYGTQGTTITSIVFSNANYSTGFEYDNVSVSTSPGAPTGTVLTTFTPEPTSIWMIGAGLLVLGRRRYRRG
jgi:hypothetical protein